MPSHMLRVDPIETDDMIPASRIVTSGRGESHKQILSQYDDLQGFPGGSDGKESICQAGDLGLISELGRAPGGGHGNPLQYFCLKNPRGQRSLEGCNPWGHKGSDTTE